MFNPPELELYIQGKLYEYIASGTPVLLYGAGGEMARIIGRLGAGVAVAQGDGEALGRALEALERTRAGDGAGRAAVARDLYRQLEGLVGAPG